MRFRRTFRRWTPWLVPASWTRFSPPPRSRRRAAPSESPFKILNSSSASQSLKSGVSPQPAARAEGDARERSGRFSRTEWDGATAELPTYLYDENTPRLLATPKHSAYIKIAEGCDHPCAFCIIPQLRGKFRSRRFESVVCRGSSGWPAKAYAR